MKNWRGPLLESVGTVQIELTGLSQISYGRSTLFHIKIISNNFVPKILSFSFVYVSIVDC